MIAEHLFSVVVVMPKGQWLSVLCNLHQNLADMPSSRIDSGIDQPLMYTQLIDPNRVQEGKPPPSCDAEDVYNTWRLNGRDLGTGFQAVEQNRMHNF